MAEVGKDEALWKAGDVARFLGITKDSVYRLVAQGKLPCVKVGTLTRFVPDEIRAIPTPPSEAA